MTLVELLVVVSIMVILVAISVPSFKPMLEAQRTGNAARTVATVLERARVLAQEKHESVALEFIRFSEGNAPTLALQMRYIKLPPPYQNSLVHPPLTDYRAAIEHDGNGKAKIVFYNRLSGVAEPSPSLPQSRSIQFNFAGRFYEHDENYFIKSPYDEMETLPPHEFTLSRYGSNAAIAATMAPPITLLRGTVVDLAFSGFGEGNCQFQNNPQNTNDPSDRDNINNSRIVIVFSPGGYVDRLYCGHYDSGKIVRVDHIPGTGELIYFLVGEWDRQVDNNGNPLAEDGRSNLETPSNFWVTVNPRTSEIRTAKVAPVPGATQTMINGDNQAKAKTMRDARRFATEHFINLGDNQ